MAHETPPTPLIDQPRWHMPVERKVCVLHPATAAVDRCDRCGQPFCAARLQHVGRWRVCAACVARLERERSGRATGERFRRFLPNVVGLLVILLLLAGIAFGINTLLGSSASNSALAGAAQAIATKQQPVAARHVTLRLTSALPPGAPPARIVLAGSHFRANEVALITATISGDTTAGKQASITLPEVIGDTDSSGNLTIHLQVPGNDSFTGPYHLHVEAWTEQGSTGTLDVTAGRPVAATPTTPQ